ncbi:hypothetical protein BJV74DRAFT_867555 [Russula compacta]|nr:hypothetical protein BJV74DRAFT_867555 [Russula compacta]
MNKGVGAVWAAEVRKLIVRATDNSILIPCGGSDDAGIGWSQVFRFRVHCGMPRAISLQF